MELKQLEVFITVVRNGSFSKASSALYMSQSSISGHISALEKELGCKLLIRSTKEIHPTEEGIEFFAYAQNMLALKDSAICSLKKLKCGEKGTISVISSSVPSYYMLPDMILGFKRKYPSIVFDIYQTDSGRVLEELQGTRYDVGFFGGSQTTQKYEVKLIYKDSLALVFPYNVKLDNKENLAVILKSMPFVMREAGSNTRQVIETALENMNVKFDELNISLYLNDTQSVLNAVSKGLGISVVSRIAAQQYEKNGLVKTLSLDTNLFENKFFLATKKDSIMPPSVMAFLEYAEGFYNVDSY